MIAFFGRCRRFLDTSLSWGGVAYSYAQPALSKSFLSQGGKLIFSDVIGAPYWAAALVFALILIGQLMRLRNGGRGARNSATMLTATRRRGPRARTRITPAE